MILDSSIFKTGNLLLKNSISGPQPVISQSRPSHLCPVLDSSGHRPPLQHIRHICEKIAVQLENAKSAAGRRDVKARNFPPLLLTTKKFEKVTNKIPVFWPELSI
jgi:hypothetical protein